MKHEYVAQLHGTYSSILYYAIPNCTMQDVQVLILHNHFYCSGHLVWFAGKCLAWESYPILLLTLKMYSNILKMENDYQNQLSVVMKCEYIDHRHV